MQQISKGSGKPRVRVDERPGNAIGSRPRWFHVKGRWKPRVRIVKGLRKAIESHPYLILVLLCLLGVLAYLVPIFRVVLCLVPLVYYAVSYVILTRKDK